MYFYHPDHLGSITMITDGNGNVLAGGERGGKSHITYKPYGEILRTDSYGPDITKFKYTGQEEDRESGLYYYKARYYDSSLGRFISNDGMVFPSKLQGMNRQMYVEGNPMSYKDPNGRNKVIHMFNRIVGHAMGRDFNQKNDLNKIGHRGSVSFKRGLENPERTSIGQVFDKGKEEAKKFLHRQRRGVDKWLIRQRNTYSEPFHKRFVKQFIVNKVCEEKGSESTECDAVVFVATFNYFRSREKWEDGRTPIPIVSEILSPFAQPVPNDRKRDSSRPLDIIYSYWCVTRFQGFCGSYE